MLITNDQEKRIQKAIEFRIAAKNLGDIWAFDKAQARFLNLAQSIQFFNPNICVSDISEYLFKRYREVVEFRHQLAHCSELIGGL